MSNETIQDGYGYKPIGLRTNLFYGIHITSFVCLVTSMVGYTFSMYKLLQGKKLCEKLAHERFVIYYAIMGLIFTVAYSCCHFQMMLTQAFPTPRFVCGMYAFVSHFCAMGQLMLVIFITGSVFLFVVMKRWMIFGKYDSRIMFYIIGVPICGMGIIATRGKFGPDGLRCGFDSVKGRGDYVTFIMIPRVSTFLVIPIMLGCIRFKLFMERRRRIKAAKHQKTEAMPNTLTNYRDDKSSNSVGTTLNYLQDIRMSNQPGTGAVFPSGVTAENKTSAMVILEHDRLIAFLPYLILAFIGQWFLPVIRHIWDIFDPHPPLFIPLISNGIPYIGGVFTLMMFFKIQKAEDSISKKPKTENTKTTDEPPKMVFKSNYEKWCYDEGLSPSNIQDRTNGESEQNIYEEEEEDESEGQSDEEKEKDINAVDLSAVEKESVRNESKQESNTSTDEGFHSGEPELYTSVQSSSSFSRTSLSDRGASSLSIKSAKIGKKVQNAPAQMSNSLLMIPVPERSSSTVSIRSTKISEHGAKTPTRVSNSLLTTPLPDRCPSATSVKSISVRNNEQLRPTSSLVQSSLPMTQLPDRPQSVTTINERGPPKKNKKYDDQLTQKCKVAQKRKKVVNGSTDKSMENNSKSNKKKEKIDDTKILKRCKELSSNGGNKKTAKTLPSLDKDS